MQWSQVKYKWSLLNAAEKLIVITSALYLINRIGTFLFSVPQDIIFRWLVLPKSLLELLLQPWSLVSYGFVHFGLWHLFFNMLILYFASRLFYTFFVDRQLYAVYFLGILSGGLLFLISYNIFPAFIDDAYLLGASAGVIAVFIFMSTYAPTMQVRIAFWNVDLKWLGIALVIIDLIQLPISNSGGHIAHLGGAAFGYYYGYKLKNGVDVGAALFWNNTTWNRWFGSSKSSKSSKKTMYTAYRKTTKTTYTTAKSDKSDVQTRIDEILDKISEGGYDSLTKEEKEFLFKSHDRL